MKLLKTLPVVFFLALVACTSEPKEYPKEVSHETLQSVFEEINTPHKYGLVMIHDDTSNMIDCPTIYRKNDKWYMTYLIFNGRGYETWLGTSDDLLHWEKLGPLLPFTDSNRWDWNQAAGYPSLVNTTWGGDYALGQHDNKYWMSYFGGNSEGYERGILSIGMAYTADDPAKVHTWERIEEPVLKPNDSTAGFWENKKLYKSSIIRDDERRTGHEFVMYYNAFGDSSGGKLKWTERIGMATSDDMVHWERHPNNPIINHHVGITGDAYIQKMDDLYVMFYYGAFWPVERDDAFNRFACSYDLVNWTTWDGADLISSSEPYDERYAHKPYVVKWNGVVYHFYCAVNNCEQRGIAVATSKDLGQSNLHFQTIQNKLKR